jgi:hypothetical protein
MADIDRVDKQAVQEETALSKRERTWSSPHSAQLSCLPCLCFFSSVLGCCSPTPPLQAPAAPAA